MWNAQPVIFEDEDEEALKARFIQMRAQYPNEDIFEVARFVFKNQKDPELRSQQAAMIWDKDLAVKEAIRQARLNGTGNSEELTKENLQQKILAATEDEYLDYREKKVKIEGYLAIAEINGWKIKAVEKKSTKKRQFAPVIISQYDD